MVVLFGLILSVGLLVDGAVVVVEYAQRKIQEGMGLAESYIKAASRMSLPIMASTFTTIAAFIPLLFWPGTTGGFMKYIPITVISVLGSSLAMALIVIPIIGTQAYKIKNLFFFFIIPLILFGVINFVAFNFLSQLKFDNYLNMGVKAITTISIGVILFFLFRYIKNKIRSNFALLDYQWMLNLFDTYQGINVIYRHQTFQDLLYQTLVSKFLF